MQSGILRERLTLRAIFIIARTINLHVGIFPDDFLPCEEKA